MDPSAKWIARPMVDVCLHANGKSVKVRSIVDSGADNCLFHHSVEEILEIDIMSGKKIPITGIYGSPVDVYFHSLEMQVVGLQNRNSVEVGFVYSDNIGGLLGQSGFFDNHKIIFEKSKDTVEIIPCTPKRNVQ
jgi:hypothetical protein